MNRRLTEWTCMNGSCLTVLEWATGCPVDGRTRASAMRAYHLFLLIGWTTDVVNSHNIGRARVKAPSTESAA